MNANGSNKHSSEMRIIDIQIKLNMNYNQAKRFKEQAELLGLLNVGGALHTKTCKVVNDNDDEFPCDVTTCCGVGPITRENYCPNCGAKIQR